MNEVIIHISDLHVTEHNGSLGKVNENSLLSTDPKNESQNNLFIEKIAALINEKYPSNEKYLLITGDIANIAEECEYATAEKLVSKLIKETSIKTENVIIIPGDHDWNERSVKNAEVEKMKSGIDFKLNEIKYQNFNTAFYTKIKGESFDWEKIIFNTTKIGSNILLLSLNSTLNINHVGQLGSVDISSLAKELEDITATIGKDKHLLLATHHNISASYDNSHDGQWDDKNRSSLLDLLNKYKIRCFFCGNEHTVNSLIINNTKTYLSDSGTVSGKNSPTGTFKCYEIKKNTERIYIENNLFHRIDTGNRDQPDGRWDIGTISEDNEDYNPNRATEKKNFIIFQTKPTFKALSSLPEIQNNNKQEAVEEEEEQQYENKEVVIYNNEFISSKLYGIIKKKKLFNSGHFHWGPTSRSLNWIDTLKLIENKEDLAFVQDAIIDVMSKFNLDKINDLIIGYGYAGTLIASKASIKWDMPFASQPYLNREHNEFEKNLNFSNTDKAYENIVIVTDVINSGSSIKKIISEQQKVFFDNTKNIYIISLIYTGSQELNHNILKIEKANYYSVLSLRAGECPYKNDINYLANCQICKDKLNTVLYLYDNAKDEINDMVKQDIC